MTDYLTVTIDAYELTGRLHRREDCQGHSGEWVSSTWLRIRGQAGRPSAGL